MRGTSERMNELNYAVGCWLQRGEQGRRYRLVTAVAASGRSVGPAVGPAGSADQQRGPAEPASIGSLQLVRQFRDSHSLQLVRQLRDSHSLQLVRQLRDSQSLQLVRQLRDSQSLQLVRQLRDSHSLQLVRQLRDTLTAAGETAQRFTLTAAGETTADGGER